MRAKNLSQKPPESKNGDGIGKKNEVETEEQKIDISEDLLQAVGQEMGKQNQTYVEIDEEEVNVGLTNESTQQARVDNNFVQPNDTLDIEDKLAGLLNIDKGSYPKQDALDTIEQELQKLKKDLDNHKSAQSKKLN